MTETRPARTATEQLLVSHAADDAIAKLHIDVPPGTPVYIDAVNFDTNFDPMDSKYAISELKEHFLMAGARLVETKAEADMVLEIRAGALSFDARDTLLGIPALPVPLSLTQTITTPEIALFKVHNRTGVAKLAVLAYHTRDGSFAGASGTQYGTAHQFHRVILFFFRTNRDDFLPPGVR